MHTQKLYLTVLFLLFLPIAAEAVPAITCHCFTDRSYDPARPAVADPYFLAAAQNSFFAAAFNVEKKTVVMKKQQGASADDLWVAYAVASQTGTPAEALLKAKQSKETWKDVVSGSGIGPKAFGTGFSDAALSGAPASDLAWKVVDSLLVRYRFIGDGDLKFLRKAGATNQEVVIASFVSVKTGQPARQTFQKVKNGTDTWGKILTEAKIDVSGMQREMSALMKTAR